MTLLGVVIVVGLFDFTNGLHDTANDVATRVGTRASLPRLAVAISAAANLAGAFVTTAVARTVAKERRTAARSAQTAATSSSPPWASTKRSSVERQTSLWLSSSDARAFEAPKPSGPRPL